MPRRTFDMLLSSVGVVLTVVLVVAGVLGFWGYSFANNNVHDQLAAQKITMPSGQAIADPAIKPYLSKYAGQQMTSGGQAEAFADHYLKVHISNLGEGTPYKGFTYSQLGAPQSALRSQIAALKPGDPQISALQTQLDTITTQRETVFKGEALRSMLLNAYGFWKVGQLALIGSVVSFVLAGLMGVLSIFGFVHFRRTDETKQILAPVAQHRASA